ncbi:hypothetical protein [Streptomyces sp. enrichment culture]
MAAVNVDPEVIRWIRDGSVRDEQQTRGGIQAWDSEWEPQGFGLFAVEIRSTASWPGSPAFRCPTTCRRCYRLLRSAGGWGTSPLGAGPGRRGRPEPGAWGVSKQLLVPRLVMEWGCRALLVKRRGRPSAVMRRSVPHLDPHPHPGGPYGRHLAAAVDDAPVVAASVHSRRRRRPVRLPEPAERGALLVPAGAHAGAQ